MSYIEYPLKKILAEMVLPDRDNDLAPQKELAEHLRREALRLLPLPDWLPEIHRLFGVDTRAYEREISLINFAEDRGVNLSSDNWRISAICKAAFEHPKMRAARPKRGRPQTIEGMLGRTGAESDRKIFETIMQIIEAAPAKSDTQLSDRKAARILALQDSSHLRGTLTEEELKSRIRKVCNAVSRHRNRSKLS